MNQEVTAVVNLNYHAYLIRIWRDNDQAPWRAATTHVGTGEIHKFASLPLLWLYLQSQLGTLAEESGPDPS
jgi:hypothetical protein